MAYDNALYPPIVATYMPAFVGNECRIYFNISDYQSWPQGQTLYAQAIVNHQTTNASALSTEHYPLGIKQFSTDEAGDEVSDKGIHMAEEMTPQYDANQLYIIIDNNDIQGGFKNGEYYRVQIRFSYVGVQIDSSSSISEHINDFSEWSTVCLIKKITEPQITVEGKNEGQLDAKPCFPSVTGTIGTFLSQEDESLKSIEIKLKYLDTVLDSGTILDFPVIDNGAYHFFYKFKVKLQTLGQGQQYTISIKYTTRNLYSAEKEFYFNVSTSQVRPTTTLNISPDVDNGAVKIRLKYEYDGDDASLFTENCVVLRTDSLSNYQNWEEILLIPVERSTAQTEKVYEFLDKTIESSVWYKYDLQYAESPNDRQGTLLNPPNKIIVPFDDVFLTTNLKQLKISLNNEISSFKYNIQETRTDTLGSKFPWIRRNAHTYYRSFGLTGTISFLGNNEKVLVGVQYDSEGQPIPFDFSSENYGIQEINKSGLFETEETLLHQDYTEYNIDNGINYFDNVYLERRFREAVIEFLYNTDVKLYRSSTEGNILVRLMNVSLTPKRELGNFIYDFSCEAVEIDDCTIDNFNKYNVQYKGEIPEILVVNGISYSYSGTITRLGEL